MQFSSFWVSIAALFIATTFTSGCTDDQIIAYPGYFPIAEDIKRCSEPDFDVSEPCGEIQGGWTMRCQDALVYVDNVNIQQRCLAGSDPPLPSCTLGGKGDEVIVARCIIGCIDLESRYFENFDDYLSAGYDIVCN